ncbi:hypothetical protein Ssi03_46170 [Sphaerisporangium siamense]|uniref:Uncharacterized protein n=1 Tax=Sphaerisporangium siamense TaxID=795645 RepID=A0A7W7D5F6_9ACTN|nr:hypothetical protein [Sphaerisporangium siamense]MBB4699246.1 hypothetical protein [Sphaerisporangium siamense]GII86627.1 hypothetical protein Ssi03_46170 [Sphaerisporangium siamense]
MIPSGLRGARGASAAAWRYRARDVVHAPAEVVEVTGPSELVDHIRALAGRYTRAVPS